MKRIYIVLTYTGTILSKIIKIYTRKKYSHVSIALDEELNRMYSFGRLNPYIPFIGGFVKEGTEFGTFKRFRNTETIIFSLEITDEQYKKIIEIINSFVVKSKVYSFNILGLFLVPFHKRIIKRNCFYCAEFVRYVIENSIEDITLPEIIQPMDFTKINRIKFEFKGKLIEFKKIREEKKFLAKNI